MLDVRALTKWYGGLLAVSDVSFALAPGEILGYLGPNGSGKTTTVGMVTGLVEPSSGDVLFEGIPIHNDLVGFRRRVGYVPEEPHLYAYLSGREHLELVSDLRDLDHTVAHRRIDALLDLFDLGSAGNSAMSSYSKGMRQKILIAAALIHDPLLIVFDEPVSGLDATSALVFGHLLNELARQGKAVLYSSHDLAAVERTCSRVVVLHQGRVVAHDAVERLRLALDQESLEGVFRQLVCETDPAQTARDLVSSMRLGA